MNKLYEKNELAFALVWIGIYVIALSAAENLSEALGTQKLANAVLGIILTAIIALWIIKNGHTEKYGLGRVKIDPKKYLFFIPLVIIASVNFWGGAAMRYDTVLESALHVISMICVGFLEEIIFRGFLFKAMCKTNVTRAVIVSSITFGIGHIVNLLNGEDLFSTAMQICYAVAIGFAFTVLFYRSGSLIPCIVTHCVINSTSAFGAEQSEGLLMIISAVLIAVSALYAVWIIRNTEKPKDNTV